MARPTKYTPEVVEKILEALRRGATYELAANYAGVSYDSFNRWMQTKSEFCEAVKQVESAAALGWLDQITKAAADGAWQAAAWKLERRYPQLYGRVSQQPQLAAQVEVSNSGSGETPGIRVQLFTFDAVAASLTTGPAADRRGISAPPDGDAGDGSSLG